MIKFFFSLILLMLALFFVGFNLDNHADLSLIFVTLQRVPVFFLAMVFFVVGFISALPFFVGPTRNPSKKENQKPSQSQNVIKSPEE